jgi:phosphatidylglycerol:prolipoprotein diacylglycerol transferase
MYPTIPLGPFEIPSSIPVDALVLVILLFGLRQRARQRQVAALTSIHDVIDVLFWAFLGAGAGSLAAVSLRNLAMAWVQGQPLPPNWWLGQYTMGGFAGAAAAICLYCRRHSLATGRVFDLFVPVVPLAEAVGRVGCLLVGCCYGREMTGWPAMVLPDVNGVWAPRFPTRIVIMIANLGIVILIWLFERTVVQRQGKPVGWPFHGFVFLLWLNLYCLYRFFMDFYQGAADPESIWAIWTHMDRALGFILTAWGLVHGLRRAQEKRHA